MSFSSSLLYALDRIAGYQTQTFRLETEAQTTAKAGSIISLTLPSNSILALSSLKVYCKATTQIGATECGGRLCPIDDLVERCEVSVGGVVLSQGAQFTNVLNQFLVDMGVESCDATLGHPEYVREKSYVDGGGNDGAALATGNNEDYSQHAFTPFAISSKVSSFLHTAAPALFDSALCSDIRVRFYLAPNAVLSSAKTIELTSGGKAFTSVKVEENAGGAGGSITYAGITGGNGFGGNFIAAGGGTSNNGHANAASTQYELSGLFATIEAIGLANETYDMVIAQQMSSQGFLEVPFKNYSSIQETHSGSTRFSISTACLDRVYVLWRDQYYDTIQGPVQVRGYKDAPAYVVTSGGVTNVGLSGYDAGGTLGFDEEKYKGAYFNYIRPGAAGTDKTNANQTLQLSLNGAFMPSFPASWPVLYGITEDSLPMRKADYNKKISLDQYLGNYCGQCFRLCMKDSDVRSLSGCDTRSSSLQGIVKSTNAGTAGVINVFLEMTSVLRLGPGRSAELIQ